MSISSVSCNPADFQARLMALHMSLPTNIDVLECEVLLLLAGKHGLPTKLLAVGVKKTSACLWTGMRMHKRCLSQC